MEERRGDGGGSYVRIMTILGTRPEIIRLSRVIPLLDRNAEHVLVHTGQNYDDRLSRIFFEQLGVRSPDEFLGVGGNGMAAQIGAILERIEALLLKRRPDRVLILGDTDSGLSALIARRLGFAVYHMEAGNRCYDDRVPEEVNRRVIDHCSTVLLPYTRRSRENLLREGIPGERIFVTGNPIGEVIAAYEKQIETSGALGDLRIEPRSYFLVTMHRAENVDVEKRLRSLVSAFEALHRKFGLPVICSVHPRTRARMEKFGVASSGEGLRFMEPFGFFDFVRLEREALCILTDSGTVQEEACLFGTPNVTIRDVTERPETLDCGSNVLSGAQTEDVVRAVDLVTSTKGNWSPPSEYTVSNVSETVVRIALGYRTPDLAEMERRTDERTTAR
jgi:UDP-N-acetylglucosamine 2-epimerase (non-hydrolysing)